MSTTIEHHDELDSICFTDDANFGQFVIVENVFSVAEKAVWCTTIYAIKDDGDLCRSLRLNIALVRELFLANGADYAEAQEVASDVIEVNAHYVASYTCAAHLLRLTLGSSDCLSCGGCIKKPLSGRREVQSLNQISFPKYFI